jgi:hypothetical protein
VLDLTLEEEDLQRIDARLATVPIPPGDMYELERNPLGPHSKIIRTDLQGAVP